MAKPPPTVEDVISFLDNLEYGRHVINDHVAKSNQAAWIEIVIEYCQSHPEVYFTSDMKAIKKIDIEYYMKKEPEEKEAA